MRRRSNLLVLLGIAFFLVGGIIVYVLTDDDGGGGSGIEAPVSTLVGNADIPAGSLADDLIAEGRLKEIKVPAGQLVAGAIQSINQLEGATFVQGFAKDQQITASGLQLVNRGFDVPEGYEAIAVQLDFTAGAAGYVNTGDRINIYGAYGPQYAIGNLETPRAELLLTNVLVLDVNQTIPARRGSADSTAVRASGDNVTYLLAVKTVDAEKLVFTTQFESMYATLTAKDAPPAGPTTGQSGETILSVEPNVAAG